MTRGSGVIYRGRHLEEQFCQMNWAGGVQFGGERSPQENLREEKGSSIKAFSL